MNLTFVSQANRMSTCVLGTQYMPSIEYYAHWLYHREITLELHEHYQKRTWRNKTAIIGPKHPVVLTVPLQKGKHQQMKISHVRIAYDEPWQKIHAVGFQSAYGKTPFFDEVFSGLQTIWQTRHESLWELNQAGITYITSLLPGGWNWKTTSAYLRQYPPSVKDLRMGVPAGSSAIAPVHIPEYPQVQRLNQLHQPNLSILDTLCHLGPATTTYLAQYAAKLYDNP